MKVLFQNLRGLFLLLFLAPTVFALPAALEMKAGLSFSNATAPSQISTSSHTGFLVGVGLEVPMGPILHLQPELTFARRGVTIVDSKDVKMTAKYDSLEVPLFLKAKFGVVLRPYFLIGPKAIFNISHSLETEVPGQKSEVSFNPKTLDFAADAGAGIAIANFFADLRYSMGITDMNESSGSWRSRGLQLNVGLAFGG